MIQLIVPFLLSQTEQIPKSLITSKRLFLEGCVFDATLFDNESYWKKTEKNLLETIESFGSLHSLHFPVDNADYLESDHISHHLYRFIDLAVSHNIKAIALHSNNIVSIDRFSASMLAKTREKYIRFFGKLDKYLMGTQLKVCIENMPIIGNHGDDYDSIFVFPQDFSQFDFSNIKIVWDIGHWSYTWKIMKLLSNMSPHVSTKNIELEGFFSLEKYIEYYHFSSFHGFALPYSKGVCIEGVIPTSGDIQEELLSSIVSRIHASDHLYPMSLEIQDVDYTKRKNLKKTIDWFEEKIFTIAPKTQKA